MRGANYHPASRMRPAARRLAAPAVDAVEAVSMQTISVATSEYGYPIKGRASCGVCVKRIRNSMEDVGVWVIVHTNYQLSCITAMDAQ